MSSGSGESRLSGASHLDERIEAFYGQAPGATRTNALLALIAAAVMWERVPHALLFGWLATVGAGHALRLAFWRGYFADVQRAARAETWAGRCTLAMLATGAAWGAGGVLMFLPGEPLLLAFWLIMLCGIAAGVVAANAFHLPATYAYVLPLLVPMIGRLALEGTREHWAIALGMTLYLAFALVQGRHQARLLVDFIRLRREAEAAGRAKAQFFAAASHDLRQPLHALALFSAALEAGGEEATRRRALERIQSGIGALESLFDEVLDIARLDAGAVEFKPVHFPAARLLEWVEATYAPEATAKGIALRVVPSQAVLYTDYTLACRVAGNLVSNAIRYTPRGAVLVACRRRGARLALQVRDGGIGIAPAEQGRVFEEFVQLGNPERDRRKGLGLGLATVKRLAALAGAPLELRSAPGRGSTFSVCFERGDPARVVTQAAAAEPADVLRGKCIAVLDDEAEVREAMQALLGSWGCTVLVAAGPEEILRSLDGGARPDALLADYRLRAGDGIAAVARVRAALARDLPAALLTGETSAEVLSAARAHGLEVIHKPVRAVRLRALLNSLLA